MMQWRGLAGLALLCAGSLVCAQVEITQEAARAKLQSVWSTLRDEPQLALLLDGTEKIGAKTVPISAHGYWKTGIIEGVRDGWLQVETSRKGYLTDLAVGDGTTFWAFNPAKNEYSARLYGSYGGAIPESAVRNLLGFASSRLAGLGDPIARLLRETYSGTDALYRSWLPNSKVLVGSTWIQYRFKDPVERLFTFEWQHNDTTGLDDLVSITGYESRVVGGTLRELNWVLAVKRDDLSLSPATFAFTPPVGARPVSAGR